MTAMLRVSAETRDRVMKIAKSDGVSADEVMRRLLDEHWERQAVEAMDRFRREDPEGWAEYLAEAAEWERIDAPVTEPWDGAA
jgi:hypothetical protein